MGNAICKLLTAIAATITFAVACVPTTVTMREIGDREGCGALEQKLPYFAEREVRRQRFKDDMKHRVVMLPVSFGMGAVANYLMGATIDIPALVPEGFKIRGDEIGAIGLDRVMSYTRLNGTLLDDVDNTAIARMTYQVGLCYYENENWAQAATYFESLRESIYAFYIGEENLLFKLGQCYYMLDLYDHSLECYRRFLKIATRADERRGQVEHSIGTIEVLKNKGLWGLEEAN